MTSADKTRMKKGFYSKKFFTALWKVFLECFLHRKMFKKNPLMGYMHMTFAFGWFLLIATGNLESRLHNLTNLNLPYFPIFFKYFVHGKSDVFTRYFTFVMDFLLLFILSGVFLAFTKRISKGLFGVKKVTRHKLIDKIALYSLWCIFPFRLFAESITSASFQSGGFLTGSLGILFSKILPVQILEIPAWWAYSVALSVFFVCLPYSRYLHIPAEALLIFARNFGLKSGKNFDSFSVLEVGACPSCGVCIDACQLNFSSRIIDTQPAYFIRSVRDNRVIEEKAYNCFICGRCQSACPVGIDTNNLRLQQRINLADSYYADFNYLPNNGIKNAEIIYFAGCMTHLTPTIKKSMKMIFETAGVDYLFLDEDASVCCGRPLMLSGNIESAQNLINYNKLLIEISGAKLLVTSCPICFKVFMEDYGLNIEIKHHSQYIVNLINSGRLNPGFTDLEVVYHDPCELGRGSGVYKEPRVLLRQVSVLQENKNEMEDSFCCGGSLGILEIRAGERDAVVKDAIRELTSGNPDIIATACPLCKKTFSQFAQIPVKDISEIVLMALEKRKDKVILSAR